MLPDHMAAVARPVPAIDFMYYVATPEFIARWNQAKEGELICRMERAIGGLPQFASLDNMLARMDAAGVEKVFIAQCKMWSYRRKWMYMDTKLEEVLLYTQSHPDRFAGLAGYDPFHITESLREIETAVAQYGFRGVYVHIYGFDIPLHDRKMYPLYAKCVELDVPVSLQVGHVLEAMPSDCARPMHLDRVACDFPDLKLVGAHTGWPWVEELISVCYKWENVWLGVELRRILARHVFRRCGENFKCFQHVELSFGYNMEVGDNVVVHRHVLLDDRGGIRLGNNVSISDYANVYSHTHSIVDQRDVTNATTTVGDGVRITYHATVLAGVHVKEQAMVGALAVATKDVRAYHVNVGIPAKTVRVKPNAPSPVVAKMARERGKAD